ncbi:hypothetical protein BC941DRAFT_426718 [Chlamydoabsidia padenii]|nr:hypothetical protein BC941DRAFT_426718 [Chlamydoabsidia padenii]
MDSLPSPPPSSSSGKNPWMVKKHQPSATPTLPTSKLERFISFVLAAWATLASVSSPTLSISNNNTLRSPPTSSSSASSSAPSSNNNQQSNAVVTRSLLPTMASQCLDLIMFTSAMIITLFSYFSGDLDTKRPSTSSHHHHSTAIKAPSITNSSSIAIIPPPSIHTIMDIKELRKWQQQSQQHNSSSPLMIDRQLEYVTATCPMDDQKHQRIMAWATSQGNPSSASSGPIQVLANGGGGDQLTSSSLQQSNHQQKHYSHSVMEEIDDDEKYTFDERWSVDGGGGEHVHSNLQQHPYQHHHTSSKMNQQQHMSPSVTSSSSGKDSALPQEEDRRLAFMEVQVASLIQQGQAALTKKIQVHERHPNEIALRRAMKQRGQQSP